ncbi:MAG: hypothetical protein AAGU15_05160 [Anaerolineaceae bacterium]
MKSPIKFLMSLFVVILLISSCTTITPTEMEPTEKLVTTTSEPIATPTKPVPANGKGVVCGYLIDEETSEPPQAALFLSPNIAAGRDDVPAMMSFSYQTNPRAEMNEEGYFCFQDVDPGIYALTLWSPPDSVEFIEDEEGQDYLWVDVKPDSVLDMGHLSQ